MNHLLMLIGVGAGIILPILVWDFLVSKFPKFDFETPEKESDFSNKSYLWMDIRDNLKIFFIFNFSMGCLYVFTSWYTDGIGFMWSVFWAIGILYIIGRVSWHLIRIGYVHVVHEKNE